MLFFCGSFLSTFLELEILQVKLTKDTPTHFSKFATLTFMVGGPIIFMATSSSEDQYYKVWLQYTTFQIHFCEWIAPFDPGSFGEITSYNMTSKKLFCDMRIFREKVQFGESSIEKVMKQARICTERQCDSYIPFYFVLGV